MIDLAEQVMVAIGERDAAVAETEKRAGDALRELTEVEGLSLGEAVEWCGETIDRAGGDAAAAAGRTGRRRGDRGRRGRRAGRRTRRPRVGERVPVRRLDDAGLAAVAAAIADPAVLARYRAKVATVPGSECLWWTGAVSGRSERERTDGGGHGRFWYAPGRVIIAHRFAFAVMHGVDALAKRRGCSGIAVTTRCASGSRRNTSWSRAQRRTGGSGPSNGGCPTARWPTRAARVGGRGNCATWRVRTRSS